MMPDQEEETYSTMFASLKHPLRRKILRILATHPSTFTEILEQVGVESAHLSYLLESLGGLIKEEEDGKYTLSDVGRAAVSLMRRVEEPAILVSPAILRNPRRLKLARVSLGLLILLGLSLLVNGVVALPTVDFRKTMIQTSVDTDLYVFTPKTLAVFSGYHYFGDGVYGVQIDFVFRNSSYTFPLMVRLMTPQIGVNASTFWNQSWYEWISPATAVREEIAVTILVSGGSAQIVSQDSFDHVHASPGNVIGEFRPTNAFILIQTAPGVGNVTLTSSFSSPPRAFQVAWFYFPNSELLTKDISTILGLVLTLPSVAFVLISRDLQKAERRRWMT